MQKKIELNGSNNKLVWLLLLVLKFGGRLELKMYLIESQKVINTQ